MAPTRRTLSCPILPNSAFGGISCDGHIYNVEINKHYKARLFSFFFLSSSSILFFFFGELMVEHLPAHHHKDVLCSFEFDRKNAG